MKKTLLALICATTVAFVSSSLYADTPSTDSSPTYKEQKAKLKTLSRADKKALFQDAKTKWESLSDSDKQAFKEKVKDVAAKKQTHFEKKCAELKENTGKQGELKERLEKKCAKYEQGKGEQIYIKLYALDLMKEGKVAK